MNNLEYIIFFQLIIMILSFYLMYRYFNDQFTQYYFMTQKRIESLSMVYNNLEDRYFKVCPNCKKEPNEERLLS